jgi:hypothetical protein
MHFVAHLFHYESEWDYRSQGFDGAVVVNLLKVLHWSARKLLLGVNQRRLAQVSAEKSRFDSAGELREWLRRRVRSSVGQFSNVWLYRLALPYLVEACCEQPNVYPSVIPNWDNTARSGARGIVLHDSTPGLFRAHLRDALAQVKSRPESQRLVFIKSWNEWAEGNYLEPDRRFGLDYLRVVKEEISK